MKSYHRDAGSRVMMLECDPDDLPVGFGDLRWCATEAEVERLWCSGVPAVSLGWSLVVRVVDRAGVTLFTFGRAEAMRLDAYHRTMAKEGAGSP